jgi:hypothetical protein
MCAKPANVSALDFVKTCHKIPALLSYRTTCGKPNCHCATGGGHGPYWYLRWRGRNGTHHHRYVRQSDVAQVQLILTARRAERQVTGRDAIAARQWLRSNARMLRALLRDLEGGL